MAININFGLDGNPESPTLVLAYKNGTKIGNLFYERKSLVVADNLNEASELTFKTYKFIDGKLNPYWDKIIDLKLLWCKEWDMWFEIKVDIGEGNSTTKTVQGTRLGAAELSQIMLYDIEINTELDISREDYKQPSILFNETNPSASILHRIIEKAPHYSIIHVDSTIAKIQRTFSFDNTSIYDAFQEIAEEIGCIFILNSNSDSNGNVTRTISVYDLETNCLACNHRGEFTDRCPECESDNILYGYGEDTTIFISSDELAKEIELTTDNDSVKNCFKLEAGDDLMTATIRNCNPNGTDYIWYISNAIKNDMSPELVSKLNEYDTIYNRYLKTEHYSIDQTLLSKYNDLVNKYKTSNPDLETISNDIVGYPALMTAYYNTIDMEGYLEHSMMPNAELPKTTATEQISLLTRANLSPVAVTDIKVLSSSTADSAVLAMAKVIVDSRYKVKIKTSSLTDTTWNGTFTVTSYSDEEDTETGLNVIVDITDNYKEYVKQKIDKMLDKDTEDTYGIVALFKLSYNNFCAELKKYCLSSLKSFLDSGRSCIDLLIEQGLADKKTWADQSPNLYEEIYVPYYNKVKAIEAEISTRESELATVSGVYDKDGDLIQSGLKNEIEKIKDEIQDTLDFEKFIGKELWLEFCTFRREDKYTNDNYISDGLNNTEVFNRALEFIENAKKDIFKSAELQHSISTSLNNLLVMDKFQPLVKYFAVGNWLRILIDDIVYKLRLISYEINYGDLSSITVNFSDVLITADGLSDQRSVIEQASAMATSYDSVKRQASQGKASKKQVDAWVTKGLALTKMKIIDDADNQNITWDSHGLLCREYLPITDTYDDKQLKIINKGLYLTDDDWKTSRAGIGNFTYYNPETGEMEESYGVIADTLIGNLILSEKVGIYNQSGSITLDENGFSLTTSLNNQQIFNIQRKDADGIEKLLYLDSDGNLVINGSFKVQTGDNKEPFEDVIDNKIDESLVVVDEMFDKIDGAETIYYSEEPPIDAEERDLWVDTVNKVVYRYNGETWTELNNSTSEAILKALEAADIADGKVQTYYQDEQPVGDLNEGDLWIDSNDNNCLYRYDGVAWVSVKDKNIDNMQSSVSDLLDYKHDLGQYMQFGDDGLTLGAKSTDKDGNEIESPFKTLIDNRGMYFTEDDTVVAYINNKTLNIENAVVRETLTLGDFFFSPREDGGVSLTWKGEEDDIGSTSGNDDIVLTNGILNINSTEENPIFNDNILEFNK